VKVVNTLYGHGLTTGLTSEHHGRVAANPTPIPRSTPYRSAGYGR
jgi:hypothetical protein